MFRNGDFWISWGGWEFGVPKRDGAETPSAESGFISLESGVGSREFGKEMNVSEGAVRCQVSARREELRRK